MLVFDIETDGLLPGQGKPPFVSKIHCINALDMGDGTEYRFTDHEFYRDVEDRATDVPTKRTGTIADGLKLIKKFGHEVAGHNINGYDLPVLKYLTGDNTLPAWGYDTKALGKLAYPNLKDMDFAAIRKGKLKGVRAGGNQLKDWGRRFGEELKADFKPKDYGHTWNTMPFTEDMDDYCMQDVVANAVVVRRFEERGMSPDAQELELRVAEIIGRQERHGVRFDNEAADRLAAQLYSRQHELEQLARESFGSFFTTAGPLKTYKKASRRFVVSDEGGTVRTYKGEKQRGWWSSWAAGAEVQPIELIDFNPGSRTQIENRLRFVYDWEPTELTGTGRAKIDENTLGSLPFKEARVISEYFTVTKRLSQLAEGDTAWMKKEQDGRIHGRVDPLGTVTTRMAHFSPNLGQVPANHNPYGVECRSLFIADEGRKIVGCDADALELRVLAHFLARYDRGAYVRTVLDGNKADGTDMHSRNRDAVGLAERDTAKTWFYAFIYGAADFKLGTIVMSEWDEAKLLRFYKAFPPGNERKRRITRLGKTSRAKLMKSLPAFAKLVDAVKASAAKGWVKGIDGRRLPVRGLHAALNVVCQGAGAVIMKRALVIMFDMFEAEGLDVIPLLNVHDEVQLSVLPEEAQRVGEIAAESIRLAGEYYDFRCPLGGDFDIGDNWSETH